MSNYTKQISWSGKDALSDSDPEKVISGGDFDTEFSAVQTAINSKIDDIVDDTTPQLGGDLDFQTHKATSFTSTGIDDNATSTAITITSDGRGLSQFTAKAWVNFNGTGTVAIRDSHNVSSITDGGTGDYTTNFTNNMTNTNYSVASATSSADWGAMSWVSDLVVGSFKIYHHASNAGSPFYQDGDIMCAQVFGD